MPKYRVIEIIRTIQGEGVHTGMPCTLVRFAGCNLACAFCDTKESLGDNAGTVYSLETLVLAIETVHVKGQMILLTGGEPTLQMLQPLIIIGLFGLGCIHIETNGTIPFASYRIDWITVSPKNKNVSATMLNTADEVKMLVKIGDTEKTFLKRLDGLPYIADSKIVLQPTSQNAKATTLAIELCLKYGWRLSIQTHKYIGVK